MQGRKKFEGKIYYNINLDSMVPEDHILKKLDRLVSFSFVREKTKSYYSYTGKPNFPCGTGKDVTYWVFI